MKIGKIDVGVPENPTVLIPSIFYEGHSILRKNGSFSKGEAEKLVQRTEELSELTEIPVIYDVVSSSEKWMQTYIEWISSITDSPFLIDSSSRDVRLAGVRYAGESGLLDRAIYNSLDYSSNEEEVEALIESRVKFSVIMAYNPSFPLPSGCIDIASKLVKRIQGIHPLIDTAVLDAPSIGLSAEGIKLVKERLGLPAGCAPSNGIFSWKTTFGKDILLAGVCCYLSGVGADFILFGPIEYSEKVFPAVAAVDGMRAYSARMDGKRISRKHPLYRIF
jgi:tetrahydromethanopterin S-methyltransferase subunit H